MFGFICKNKGTISVFLTLILLPTFIFGGVIVDGSRILGAKNIISGAGDLAMNGALSNYNEELKKTYGLLGMADTPEKVEDIMKDFFSVSLNAAGVSKEDFSKALIYLELTDDFSAVGVPKSEIYQTEVMRQEILEYMKYRAPVILGQGIMEKLDVIKNAQKEKDAANGQVEFESSMDGTQELLDKIKFYTDELERLYKLVYDADGQNRMLALNEEAYEKICWMTVANKRIEELQGGMESKSGDKKSLMQDMCNAADDLTGTTEMTPDKAAAVIEMLKIKNGVGSNPDSITLGLSMQSEEYKEAKALVEDYESACTTMEMAADMISQELETAIKGQYNTLNAQRQYIEMGKEYCEKLVGEDGSSGLLKKLEKEFSKLQTKYDNWKGSVEKLDEDSESKKGYEKNLKDTDAFFSEDNGIEECRQKINQSRIFYTELLEQLDMATFTGKRLDEEIASSADFGQEPPYSGVSSAAQIRSNGTAFKNSYVSVTINLSVKNVDISSDKLVTLLKEKYCKKNANADEKQAEEASNAGDAKLADSLKNLKTLFLSDDVVEKMPETEEIPSVWLNAAKTEQEESKTPNIGSGLNDKKGREEVSGSGSDGMDTGGLDLNILGVLSKGGASLVKPLFITEYAMGMFSYYTCNRDTDGKEIDPDETLTGESLKDNALYRAEVEYILWGDTDVRDNISKTKALIYAINLIFNICFVFTNTEIRGQATKTAALFPVPPVAQTAIKCALQVAAATVESVKNLMDLCEGKEVALVKTASDWETWIPTFSSQGKLGSSGSGKASIKFTYRDYMWIFVCINMYTTQDDKLARMADCIELNLDDGSLKDMFTMVQVETKVNIDTFFINRLNGAGYDVQKVDKDTFQIPYVGIAGY